MNWNMKMNDWTRNSDVMMHHRGAGWRPPRNPSPPWQQLPNRAAFSLIELLVVIAIIGILAALLLTTLARAKSKVRTVQCANHLRQWHLAMDTYSDETGFLPREGFLKTGRVRPDQWANVADTAADDVWYNALPPKLDVRPAKSYASSENGERPRFYDARIFHCPNARFPAGAGTHSRAYFSLAMNSKLIQPPVTPSATITMSSIQEPSRTAVFLDARVNPDEVKVDPLQWESDLGQPSIFASRFAARHDGGGNIAFADGHVSRINGRSVVETFSKSDRDRGFAIFPGGEVIWSPDPLTNPNGPE